MTKHGLVMGKFLPPHAGHHHLIETAQAGCDELTIVIFGRSDEPIPLEVRRGWLAEAHPTARLVTAIDDHAVDFNDADAWAYWVDATLRLYGYPDERPRPDVVFSSEAYGDELARRIGCAHQVVDAERSEHLVSGSLVREDPLAAWPFLRPEVRSFFVKRIAIVGAESTGKTTLSASLAAHFDTTWVAEFGREYCEERGLEDPWTSDEFVAIARRQLANEDAAARLADRVLICDTDALATGVWHEHYSDGRRNLEVEALIRPYDLYLLALPDVPWVDDGLRDGEHARDAMTARFVERLAEVGARVVELGGPWPEREAAAIGAIEAVLAEPWAGAAYRPDEPGMTRHV